MCIDAYIRKKRENSIDIRKKCALVRNKCIITLVRKTCKNLAVVLYSQYIIIVQNSIQISNLVLSDRSSYMPEYTVAFLNTF